MDYLLDTHIAIWAMYDDNKLNKLIKQIIENPENNIFVSSISVLEISIKNRKHPDLMPIDANNFVCACKENNFVLLPLKANHIVSLDSLSYNENAPKHGDILNRLLICQAKQENMMLISHDHLIRYYKENCILSI